MTQRKVEVALALNGDRSLPPAALGEIAKTMQASGVVDEFLIWDQMLGFWPPALWTRENSPMAELVPDTDSFGDATAVAAYAAASAPGMGLVITYDSIRRGPAEMMQTMLTLANMSGGRATLQLGAGELKQNAPFGWKRAEGVKRLEDHLRFYDAFWKNEGPVDMSGHFWNFDQAWIGRARQNRPKMMALGGGPKLIDLATSYADGFATTLPNVMSSPEQLADFIKTTNREVEKKGRDPSQFDYCVWVTALIHEDPAVIDRALDNPLMRWFAGCFGRFNQGDWAAHGLEPALPLDWHYAKNYLPNKMFDRKTVDPIIDRVPRKMRELSYFYGSPSQVAAKIKPYIDAGATSVAIGDVLPAVLQPADAKTSLQRQIDTCRAIKALVSA